MAGFVVIFSYDPTFEVGSFFAVMLKVDSSFEGHFSSCAAAFSSLLFVEFEIKKVTALLLLIILII
jgi:hypothetical protein